MNGTGDTKLLVCIYALFVAWLILSLYATIAAVEARMEKILQLMPKVETRRTLSETRRFLSTVLGWGVSLISH